MSATIREEENNAMTIPRNLRHLRLILALANLGSVTQAARLMGLSQPAVTQALNKLDRACGAPLFERTANGIFLTKHGYVLLPRLRAAFAKLDAALDDIAPRLRLTFSHPQMQALIAVSETENFTTAARRLGLAQPTVHRAITQIEQEVGRRLFDRTTIGILPNKQCERLAQAARLALYELSQADAELAALDGEEIGKIVIGAMPLARAAILPQALLKFREHNPRRAIHVVDGPYDQLLLGLRRGNIDMLIGALREPQPADDVEQEMLLVDQLAILCGPNHPMIGAAVTLERLRDFPWVIPPQNTPSRAGFDLMWRDAGLAPPERRIESLSLLLMREVLRDATHLGCISATQSRTELQAGMIYHLPIVPSIGKRHIGLTTRRGWQPTKAQALMKQALFDSAAEQAAIIPTQ